MQFFSAKHSTPIVTNELSTTILYSIFLALNIPISGAVCVYDPLKTILSLLSFRTLKSSNVAAFPNCKFVYVGKDIDYPEFEKLLHK